MHLPRPTRLLYLGKLMIQPIQKTKKSRPSLLTSCIFTVFATYYPMNAMAALPMVQPTQLQTQASEASQAVHVPQASQSLKSAQHLAKHPSWLRLLHYPEKSANTASDNPTNVFAHKHSRVKQASFFVSPQGAKNPQAEMQAMLDALLSADDANKQDASVQCRFPARTAWLTQQFNLKLTKASCPKYEAWFNTYQPQQLAVVFAQEYPDSMTSAFAHTLLRIDTSSEPQKTDYKHSYALNYTLDGNKNDNAAAFAIKSMTGRYPSTITIDPYITKLNGYLNKDQRDVWTYKMQLTQAETEQIIRHVWEVKDLSLPYYFFTSNCASEILRLVDVVRPKGQLYNEVSKFSIPSEVVRLLDSKGLLSSADYNPADASVRQANAYDKTQLAKDVTNKEIASKDNASHFDYLRRLYLNTADNSPVDGFNVQKATFGLGRSGEHDFAEVGVRVSYRDLLDPTSGYRQNLDMDGLHVKLRAYANSGNADSIELQELMLLRGRSYHPINTARSGKSWGLELSAKQVKDASVNYQNANPDDSLRQQHLVGNLTYEKGASVAFGKANYSHEMPAQLCYGFGSGNVQLGKGLSNHFRVGVGATLGCAYHPNERLRTTAELALPYWYHAKVAKHNPADPDKNRVSGYWQPKAKVGLQYDIAKNHALRLQAEHEFSKRVADTTDVQLAWQWYF